jgi:hypothetical protein
MPMKSLNKTHALAISLWGIVACMALFSVGCHKEKFATNSDQILSFSNDTVLFDTLFSTIGSTTKAFRVYNTHDETLVIQDLRLRQGANSPFRMNVDGDNGFAHENVEILPNDSIWIFVEVTIDPSNSNTPFVVEDYIDFETNGTAQRVLLNAWGQDAHFHGGLGAITTLGCNEVWFNDKPHVIYGIVVVEEDCQLNIQTGVDVYVHGKGGIWVNKGELHIDGALGDEVVFQGDRLEAEYNLIPGQWGIQVDFAVETNVGPELVSVVRGGIWLFQTPNSTIDYAILRNGNMGIQVDTTGNGYDPNDPAVEITNTKILNMAGRGLWAQGASLSCTNVLVGNCGESAAWLGIGGMYRMDNCTFANYGDFSTRTVPTFALTNYYEDINDNLIVRPLTDCQFRNCIMYGNNAALTDFNEFVVQLEEEELQNYTFKYCLVDTDQDVDGGDYQNMSTLAPYLAAPSDQNFKISASGASQNRMLGLNFGDTPFTDIDGQGPYNGSYYKGCYNYSE